MESAAIDTEIEDRSRVSPPSYCDHRDYKRIEAASGDEPRNKLNKSNGGQI